MRREVDHREPMAESERANEKVAVKKGNGDGQVFNIRQKVIIQTQLGNKTWDENCKMTYR